MTARHVPPTDTRASGYIEAEVSAWIHARIRGEQWQSGPVPEHPTIIRLREAQERTSLSNFTLWTLEQAGKFPRRIRLTEKVTRPPTDTGVPHRVGFIRRSAAQLAE